MAKWRTYYLQHAVHSSPLPSANYSHVLWGILIPLSKCSPRAISSENFSHAVFFMPLVSVQRCMRHKLALPHRLNRARGREGRGERDPLDSCYCGRHCATVSPVKHLISTTTILVARQDQQKYSPPSPCSFPSCLAIYGHSCVGYAIVCKLLNCLLTLGKL